MEGRVALPIIVGLVGLSLLFDLLNGLHDAANSIATVVSTRVLSPALAVVWASFFNFVAFLVFGLHVATTLGTGIVDAHIVDAHVIFGALIGAITWNITTWIFGIPSSSSHALIGGMVGAGAAKAGIGAVVWGGLGMTIAAIVLSPLLGFMLALLLVLVVTWLSARDVPLIVDRRFRRLQLISASLYSLGHGGNDAQKTMGVIAVLLYSQGLLAGDFHVPLWVVPFVSSRHGARHDVGRLAHRENDGLTDNQANSSPGLLRRDRRGNHIICGDLPGDTGFDDAYDYRRSYRRWSRTPLFSRALERGELDRRSLGPDTSGNRADRRSRLLGGGRHVSGATSPETQPFRYAGVSNSACRCARNLGLAGAATSGPARRLKPSTAWCGRPIFGNLGRGAITLAAEKTAEI